MTESAPRPKLPAGQLPAGQLPAGQLIDGVERWPTPVVAAYINVNPSWLRRKLAKLELPAPPVQANPRDQGGTVRMFSREDIAALEEALAVRRLGRASAKGIWRNIGKVGSTPSASSPKPSTYFSTTEIRERLAACFTVEATKLAIHVPPECAEAYFRLTVHLTSLIMADQTLDQAQSRTNKEVDSSF